MLSLLGPLVGARLGGVRMMGLMNYEALSGRPRSFAKEAGEFALAGEVPVKTHDGLRVATFAGGCFWSTELHFQRQPGVVVTCVGYTQGRKEAPTYRQVCSGETGVVDASSRTSVSSCWLAIVLMATCGAGLEVDLEAAEGPKQNA